MKYSILIFEDDMDLATQWATSLRERGMDVDHAMSVDEAVEYCNQKQYDALVIDVFVEDEEGNFLPKAGYTLLSYLRNTSLEKVPKWSGEVPVLSVTGSQVIMGYDILDYAKSLGANATLRKPFSTEELYLRIVEIIKYPSRDDI